MERSRIRTIQTRRQKRSKPASKGLILCTELSDSSPTCSEDLVDAISFWCDIYNLCPSGSYRTSFEWDDSIVTDAEAERQSDRQDVAMGAMPLYEYRMKWYGEDEEKQRRWYSNLRRGD